MSPLIHSPLSDKEKLFIESEAKFVDSSAQHYRALATIAATEFGFMLTALTLAGTNALAKHFVLKYAHLGEAVSILLLLTLFFGTLQGRLMSRTLLYGNRASFLPDDARVKLSNANVRFSNEQMAELLRIADNGSAKNAERFKKYARLNHWAAIVASASFFLANVAALLFVLAFLTGKQ